MPLGRVLEFPGTAEQDAQHQDELSDSGLPIDRRCELINGTPIHPNLVLATMGIATFRRQIMSAAGRTIDLSVNARCFTPWQKQALLVEARGRCKKRGCDAPFAWLEADHDIPYSQGGLTKLSNGNILCSPDNKHKRDKPAA